jgi:hypothetical protein
MFSYVSLEGRVPEKYPLRAIRTLVDAALQEMNGALTACTRIPADLQFRRSA